MRSNVPAMIDEAVAKHVAQAMANIRQPADGAPGPAGPAGKLEIVKDLSRGESITTAISSSEMMARCIRPTETPQQLHHMQTGAASRALATISAAYDPRRANRNLKAE
jgi:hypothetical protein